ncbi:MAG: hypothetical protein Q4G00_02515 [Clostridia bacterium]|nr:hypothetical protein [Clostridia bacterium]
MAYGIKPGMMKYCVVGNIVTERLDENGEIRHGIASFPGGRKVYISKRIWDKGVVVCGLNRFKSKYVLETVPLACIENIRAARTFKPHVLELMADPEFKNFWWLYIKEDQVETEEYVQILNRIKAGDQKAFDQYYADLKQRYY